MSDGSEFQVCGAATENARRANSVRILAEDSSESRKIAEAEQEQLAGSGRASILASMMKAPGMSTSPFCR